MENEAIQAADLLIAWTILSALTFVAIYALLQSNKMATMCLRAYEWSKDAISANYDVQDFHEDMAGLYEKNKSVPAKALLILLINTLLLYSVKIGDVSFMLKLLAACTNAHLMVTVYGSTVMMNKITRFMGAVETEAALREMKRTEDKKENEDE